jgi:hypothetical protein
MAPWVRHVGLTSLLFGLVALLFFGLGLVFIRQEDSPQSIELTGVASQDLECLHMKLLEPERGPKVSADQALETATEAGGPFGLPVQQVVLATLVQEGPEGNLRDNLVWAVVSSDGRVRQFDGPSGPGLEAGAVRKSKSIAYELALVDALSGEFLFGMYGPPSPGYTCP